MDGHHERGERGVRRLHRGHVAAGSDVGTAGNMTHEGGVKERLSGIIPSQGVPSWSVDASDSGRADAGRR